MHTFGEAGAGVPAFLAKLWRLVEDTETNSLISWSKDGRSFIIQNQAQFARDLLPLNYKHNNMASFIRQLNMYGFHKITSIDNGGLKFDRDEMEFSHPCFKRDTPYLLEHIKRKIATTKTLDDKNGGNGTVKPEAVHKVLNEVKVMKGKQESLDSRFNIMKQENEALWREIATLRQKHMKQQQIVNKLIQFLVTIVQPSRNMSGVKRHFQLMINDAPQNAKNRKTSESDSSGPVIHELTEELLEVAENNGQSDLLTTVPNIASPGGGSYSMKKDPTMNVNQSELSQSSNPKYDLSSLSPEDAESLMQQQYQYNDVVYHVTEISEDYDTDKNQQSNTLDDPQKSLEEQKRNKRKRSSKNLSGKMTKCDKSINNGSSEVPPPLYIKTENDVDQLFMLQDENFSNIQQEAEVDERQDQQNQEYISCSFQNHDKEAAGSGLSSSDFISNEIPNDLFEVSQESPMLGDINLAAGSYNDNTDFKPTPSSSGIRPSLDSLSDESKSLALAKYNKNSTDKKMLLDDNDMMRLNSMDEVTTHIDGMQDNLDSLKELLRGEGYTLDANSLLNSSSPSPNRLYFPQQLDSDMLSKLFGDSDLLNPYSLSLSSPEHSQDNKKGSELMAYQPYSGDLSDMLDMNPLDYKSAEEGSQSPEPPSSVLNTPYHQ